MAIEPQKIELQPGGVSIEWKGGHKSYYPYKYLRINCACAHCVEEWTNRKLLNPASVPEDIQALDYIQVGRYAYQFLWSDGHSTGIYPYKLIRDLCPCDECAGTRAKPG